MAVSDNKGTTLKFAKRKRQASTNISKKINGKVNIDLKSTDSFVGRIEKTNFTLLFENI